MICTFEYSLVVIGMYVYYVTYEMYTFVYSLYLTVFNRIHLLRKVLGLYLLLICML
jgi:hypothetical protein